MLSRRLYLKPNPGRGFDVREYDHGTDRLLAEGVSIAVLSAFFVEGARQLGDGAVKAAGPFISLFQNALSLTRRRPSV